MVVLSEDNRMRIISRAKASSSDTGVLQINIDWGVETTVLRSVQFELGMLFQCVSLQLQFDGVIL